MCSGLTWVSSSSETTALSALQEQSPPAPTMECEEERKEPAVQKTQKRNPFSPEIMKSKSSLLQLRNSLCDSEATQFNRVSIIIIIITIKVLGLAPASFLTNLHAD